MELEEIEVFIARDGTVWLQVRGVKGPSCLDLTKPFEEALGGHIVTRERTPEADEAARVDESSRRTGQRRHPDRGHR